jgi:hypothetical protein
MNKQILLDYAEIKKQITKLEEEAEMIKPLVLQEIQEIRGNSEDPVQLQELPGYQYSVNKGRKKWTYSVFVKEQEDELKEAKKHEEADGTAVFEEGEPVLVFKPVKE